MAIQTARITDFNVVGSSRRCLILDLGDKRVFCSTSNYAYLCQYPNAMWEVDLREGGERRHLVTGEHLGVHNSSYWVKVYKPTYL